MWKYTIAILLAFATPLAAVPLPPERPVPQRQAPLPNDTDVFWFIRGTITIPDKPDQHLQYMVPDADRDGAPGPLIFSTKPQCDDALTHDNDIIDMLALLKDLTKRKSGKVVVSCERYVPPAEGYGI